MSKYAAGTSVSVEKSKAEIEGLLTRYGADQFMSGWKDDQAVIGFRARKRYVRFILPLPDREEKRFTHYNPGGGHWSKRRSPEQALAQWEQACRQRWRALALVVKAKLEAVETGITTFEDEFLAHIVTPSGQTVGDWLRPQLDAAYESGKMPLALPGFTE